MLTFNECEGKATAAMEKAVQEGYSVTMSSGTIPKDARQLHREEASP